MVQKTSGAAENLLPTVSRVDGDTIIDLVRDQDKNRTVLLVSRFGGLWNLEQEVRTSSDDILIPYSADNSLIASECVLLPSMPEHHGDKATLLAEIESFIHRYVDVSPLFERIAAHYVLLSWVYDAFGDIGYLRLRGAYGSGKTRGLLAIGSLCYKPFFASAASTVSPIFHTLHNFGGTLILDEADFRFSDPTSELVKILNNGTTNGLPVLRTIQNKKREFDPRAFRVFGLKIVAMRGSFADPALESRFITEEMGRRPLREDIAIALPKAMKVEALALRNQLLHFRICNLFSIKLDETTRIHGASPRVSQLAMPLLSLIDDPAVRARVVAELVAQDACAETHRKDSFEARLTLVIRDAFATSSRTPVTIGEITRILNSRHAGDYGHQISNRAVGQMVRRQLSLKVQRSNGVYVIPISEKPKINARAAIFCRDVDLGGEMHSDTE